jgi:hypothetical protein
VFKPVDSRRWLIALFVTLLLLFELYLYMPKGRASRYELDRAPSFVSFLQQRVREEDQPFRVYGTGLLMLPQSSSVFGIQDIRTFSPLNTVYYQTLMDRLVDLRGLPPPYQRSLFASPRLDILRSKLLNLLNVKYVVTKEDIFKDKNDLKKRYTKVFHDTDCNVAVYENLEVMPRAFVARAARRFNSDNEIADSLEHASDKELRTTVLVRELPEGYNSHSKTNPESLPHDGVRITHYDCRRLGVEAELDGPAYLFVSDTFYPGWRAIVDGKEKQIIRSNCAFRSVFLPAGAHTVEFVYRPLSFYLGAVLSCATLLLLVSWVFVGRRNR